MNIRGALAENEGSKSRYLVPFNPNYQCKSTFVHVWRWYMCGDIPKARVR